MFEKSLIGELFESKLNAIFSLKVLTRTVFDN